MFLCLNSVCPQKAKTKTPVPKKRADTPDQCPRKGGGLSSANQWPSRRCVSITPYLKIIMYIENSPKTVKLGGPKGFTKESAVSSVWNTDVREGRKSLEGWGPHGIARVPVLTLRKKKPGYGGVCQKKSGTPPKYRRSEGFHSTLSGNVPKGE